MYDIIDKIINAIVVLSVPAIVGIVGKFIIEIKTIRQCNKVLMRQKIKRIYKKAKEQGFIYDDDLEDVEEMFELYEKNDGNHYIADKVMPYLRKLEPKESGLL